jgi:hypothetical protein
VTSTRKLRPFETSFANRFSSICSCRGASISSHASSGTTHSQSRFGRWMLIFYSKQERPRVGDSPCCLNYLPHSSSQVRPETVTKKIWVDFALALLYHPCQCTQEVAGTRCLSPRALLTLPTFAGALDRHQCLHWTIYQHSHCTHPSPVTIIKSTDFFLAACSRAML